MSKKRKIISLAVLGVLLLASLALSLLLGKGGAKESLQTIMRDAVLHEDNKISLFGLMDVNPAVVSGFIVTGVLLVLAALARIFVIPRFKYKPGKLQLLLEELVTFFQNLAQTNSPHRNGFLGAYLFGAGVYVLFGTLFELFGLQAVTTAGGVRCDEVNPETMESRRVRGLYFAGEVLDLDANTGGYNLQIAFSTGRLAGMLKK